MTSVKIKTREDDHAYMQSLRQQQRKDDPSVKV